MGEKLFIVEGASGSGKSSLCSYLSKERGYKVIRGMPSQYPKENLDLTHRAREILGTANLNFKEALKLPFDMGTDLVERSSKVATLQFKEAKRAMNQGDTVLLKRSMFSLMGHVRLAYLISHAQSDEHLAKWSKQKGEDLYNEAHRIGLMGVNGIIFLESTFWANRKQSGISGFEAMESILIDRIINEVTHGNGFKIPLLQMNPNEYGDDEGLQRMVNRAEYFIENN